MTTRPLPVLSMLEARVLAVLVEKERTVPDTYPMTLNAITAGCNQKSSRHPVIAASESEVQAAIDALRRSSLVIESSGGRVMRYAQNARRVLDLPSESVALLATLVLRGPQTAGELRINCERLHRFADISSVEGYLRELANRPGGALVAELARQPGARENRWASLLAGPVARDAPAPEALAPEMLASDRTQSGATADASTGKLAALEAGIARLEHEVRTHRDEVRALRDAVNALENEVQALGATVARLRGEPGVEP
ncbi:MAG TPA: YceH family protein [Zeimonas sp.]|nr:YceH family protein [Zeimonas sp.]